MLNKLANLSEKMTLNHPMVDQWLGSRRQLLVAYYQLVGLTPSKDDKLDCDKIALDSFCQHLVDYLSTGHFKHYHQIELLLANDSQQQLVSVLYPQLETSTHKLLGLHDEHLEPAIKSEETPELRAVISELGMSLEAHFDLEDQLLLSTQLIKPAPTNDTLEMPSASLVHTTPTQQTGMLDS